MDKTTATTATRVKGVKASDILQVAGLVGTGVRLHEAVKAVCGNYSPAKQNSVARLIWKEMCK